MEIIFLIYAEFFVRRRRTTMIAVTVITVTRPAISKIVAVLSVWGLGAISIGFSSDVAGALSGDTWAGLISRPYAVEVVIAEDAKAIIKTHIKSFFNLGLFLLSFLSNFFTSYALVLSQGGYAGVYDSLDWLSFTI
jgi:hypothetical protein